MASVIVMPRLSPTMEEGVLSKWTKKVGDKIMPGDVIAEVETDKANMDFPLEDEGVLLKLLVNEGDTIKLGAPVAILGAAGEDPAQAIAEAGAGQPAAAAPAVEAKKPEAAKPEAAKPEAAKADAPVSSLVTKEPAPGATARILPDPMKPAGNGQTGRVKASPLARKVAEAKGVDLHEVEGSGPGGRVVKRDVEAAAATGATTQLRSVPAPSAPSVPFGPVAEDQLVQPSQMRKTIARRLVEAKREVPHIYLTAEATVDRLLELRTEMNDAGGAKISVNDLVVKALALALRRVPDANVSWTAEGIVRHGRVDIGVAVSLPDGLITPVVRAADQKSLGAVATEVKSLAERARAKKLKPEEFSNGTATVSNLGMYGVKEFVAIINPPESVILAVGTTEKRPIVVEKDGRDEVIIARRMTLTLSCDHRVVDGVLGAQLLSEIVKLLEKPMGLVL
jgi:pyruvate dehydrogenase E2 component (dihydrolipoamide acetyltransferase)